MQNPQLKGLSASTKELLYPLLGWSSLEFRWRGELNTAAILKQVGDTGETLAIPMLLSFAMASDREVRAAARSAIRRLFEQMSIEQLPALDEALRQSWAHLEDWYGIKPAAIRKFKTNSEDDLVLLALTSGHRDGFVRSEAIRALGEVQSATVIPFLLVRLVDWVEAVRRVADIALMEKLKPAYGATIVRCLGLLQRLSENSRFRQAYSDWIVDLLKDPVCAVYVSDGLKSHDCYVRRQCYPIAVGNPALSRKEVVGRAIQDVDVTVRKWVFAVGPGLLTAGEVDWIKLAVKDSYPPIRRKAYDALVANQATPEELSSFLFDRSVGIRRACQALFLDRFGIQPVERYRSALVGSNSRKTEVAARGLAETGSCEDACRLLRLLAHRSARVRRAAVYGLSKLKAENLQEALLDVITADTRSVVGEAALVLLQRRTTSSESIWIAARKNPQEEVLLTVLRQMKSAGKWAQLKLYLEAAATGNIKLAECAVERMMMWEQQYNKTFVQPSASEASVLLDLLRKVESRVSHDLRKRLNFILTNLVR
jgi:HEAT repeat protein